ncbi:MAG: GMC family oxidoreductase, partial [Litoreibacter sp.]|nr:GMC family oxidoreductase [Litoreibacter sp.]
REAGATLIEGWNVPRIRLDFERWTQLTELYLVIEDLPQAHNRVLVDPENETRPLIQYLGQSEYFYRGLERAKRQLPEVLASLPVERIEYLPLNQTEGHTQGTTPFGHDPANSVVDRELIHHKVRNLYVVGNSVFPTGAPANPTLTNTALATRAAELM